MYYQSINQSIKSINQINQSIKSIHSSYLSSSCIINQSINQINQSINQINQSINQIKSINQSNRSIPHILVHHVLSINQSIKSNQSINQSIKSIHFSHLGSSCITLSKKSRGVINIAPSYIIDEKSLYRLSCLDNYNKINTQHLNIELRGL